METIRTAKLWVKGEILCNKMVNKDLRQLLPKLDNPRGDLEDSWRKLLGAIERNLAIYTNFLFSNWAGLTRQDKKRSV